MAIGGCGWRVHLWLPGEIGLVDAQDVGLHGKHLQQARFELSPARFEETADGKKLAPELQLRSVSSCMQWQIRSSPSCALWRPLRYG